MTKNELLRRLEELEEENGRLNNDIDFYIEQNNEQDDIIKEHKNHKKHYSELEHILREFVQFAKERDDSLEDCVDWFLYYRGKKEC